MEMKMENTILIIDDEKTNVEHLANILQNDYIVKVALSASKGFKLATSCDVDLILLDVHMPEVDGYDMAKTLQNDPKTKDIPIVFLTADNSEKALIKAFEAGAKDYLLKPCSRTELLLRVQNHINTYKLEKELVKTSRKALQASKCKSDFLANMSHEIRTPLNGMLGFVDVLLKNETEEEKQKKLKIIKSSGKQLLEIVNDILDYSKIEAGKFSLESQPYHTRELIYETSDTFLEIAKEKKIDLHCVVDESIPQMLIGDEVRIKQVLYNLLSNAVKFTQENGKITISLKYDKLLQRMSIEVEDTGIGIAKDKLNDIFLAFTQEDISTTKKYGGTGLGLTLTLKLVKLMGGEMRVQSVVDVGSTFIVELPSAVCQELEQCWKNESTKDETSFSFDGHILVVEDNKTNQMLICIILKDLGLTFDLANDGIEALEKYKSNTYDVVLMDENMPNMNGIEATQHIKELQQKENSPRVPIIAVTANGLSSDKKRFIDAGMDDYIPKPYSEEDIIKVLQKYLG